MMRLKKRLSRYLSFGAMIASLFVGLISLLLTVRWAGWKISLLFSLLMTAGLLIALPVVLWFNDRKYRDIVSKAAATAVYSAIANVLIGNRQRNGYLSLSKDALAIYIRDKKPHIEMTINRQDASCVRLKDAAHLVVGIREQNDLVIVFGGCADLYKHMRNCDWKCL